MLFHPLSLSGAFLVEQQALHDERGSFARAFCDTELAEHGIDFPVRQINNSRNRLAGTIRGFHCQLPPHAEQKFLRCVRGSFVDVIVDLRPESPTFLTTVSVELSADNQLAVLVPERCAHAMQTLEDDTEALYLVSNPYTPHAEFGVRHDDPLLAIDWPIPVTEVSPKDRSWPLLAESLPLIHRYMTLESAHGGIA
jgi:dTDP-4-dehydrorhamnose 3,5-epimerase